MPFTVGPFLPTHLGKRHLDSMHNILTEEETMRQYDESIHSIAGTIYEYSWSALALPDPPETITTIILMAEHLERLHNNER